jgi:hypothetical protein
MPGKTHKRDGTPITEKDVNDAYMAGYSEARQRAQWTIAAAVDESTRLRNALEWALDEVQDENRRVRILAAMHRRQPTNHERD